MTLQTPELLTEHEARRLTERIRTALDRVATSWADLSERVTEAYERRADLAMGYESWAAYADAELKPSGSIAAEVRRELVGLLSGAGLSTRAIAPVVGVGQTQIRRDIEVSHQGSPVERIDPITGEVITESSVTVGGGEAPTVAEPYLRAGTPPVPVITVEEQEIGAGAPPAPRPATIVGLDGKQYARQAASASVRRPLKDGFRDASLDLDKIVARFERLVSDDRYPKNRDEVARYRNDLIRARDALDRLVGQMATT